MNIHNTPDPAATDSPLSSTILTNKPKSKTTPTPAASTVKPAVPQLQPQAQAKAWRGPWWKN